MRIPPLKTPNDVRISSELIKNIYADLENQINSIRIRLEIRSRVEADMKKLAEQIKQMWIDYDKKMQQYDGRLNDIQTKISHL